MQFCKRSYQPILRYLYTEDAKRRGEISLHKHFNMCKNCNYIQFLIAVCPLRSFVDTATCISLDRDGRHFISGSRDLTCMVWSINHHSGTAQNVSSKPLQVLYGHDSQVTSVVMSWELDIAVSADKVRQKVKGGNTSLDVKLLGLRKCLRLPSLRSWVRFPIEPMRVM